jgi:hypothetical protein
MKKIEQVIKVLGQIDQVIPSSLGYNNVVALGFVDVGYGEW